MKARFALKEDPQACFIMDDKEFYVGRSSDCNIFIKDDYVHRRHVKVSEKQDHTYTLEKLGQNPVLINGVPVHDRKPIKDGDVITIGKTELVFKVEEEAPAPDHQIPDRQVSADKTVFLDPQDVGKKLGPRLVLTKENGESESHPLDQQQILIGRSEEAGIVLHHPAVSSRHCIIENREGAFFVKNVSTVNPILLNEKMVLEGRLYGGDRIKIGPFTYGFISDRPEDVRPPTIISRMGLKAKAALAVLILLLLSAGGYIGYSRAYRPWQLDKVLNTAAAQVERKEYLSARKLLQEVMAQELPPKQAERARSLLLKNVLGIARQMEEGGQLMEARKQLTGFLDTYGAGKPADALLNHIDRIRIKIAAQLVASGQPDAALREYSSIWEQSQFFDAAQSAISRLWLQQQQNSYQDKKIPELVKEAEKNFIARRYLVPVNDNAFAAYQAILAVDPGNSLALQRIEQMKAFYRENGERYFKERKWERAIIYFRRFSLIDPNDQEIKSRILSCQKEHDQQVRPKRADSKAAPKKTEISSDDKKNLREVLEKSESKTDWVMKYLFSEQEGEKPWD